MPRAWQTSAKARASCCVAPSGFSTSTARKFGSASITAKRPAGGVAMTAAV